MRRALAVVLAALLLTTSGSFADAAGSGAPPKWNTRIFARVGAPGFPAYVHVARNGRVYAGSYEDPNGSALPSRVFEWTSGGALRRSWAVPGQHLDEAHGVQVANQTRGGKLIVLETSTRSVLTLDTATGRWRRIVQLPSGSIPNYASWGPGGALYVTDFGQGVLWRIRHGRLQRWFSSPALSGVDFGTTGIRYRPARHDFLITQQTSSDGAAPPTDGHLYRLPVRSGARPGTLRTLWTSRPGDLPDGFGIGRSGHVYIALAGSSNQLVELTAAGTEVDRFPQVPGAGTNNSPIPYDTPCSATFLGRRVLVANQSAVQADPSHHAILKVYVGERGVAPYLPRSARFR